MAIQTVREETASVAGATHQKASQVPESTLRGVFLHTLTGADEPPSLLNPNRSATFHGASANIYLIVASGREIVISEGAISGAINNALLGRGLIGQENKNVHFVCDSAGTSFGRVGDDIRGECSGFISYPCLITVSSKQERLDPGAGGGQISPGSLPVFLAEPDTIAAMAKAQEIEEDATQAALQESRVSYRLA